MKSVPSCGDTNSSYDIKWLHACPLFTAYWARVEILKQNKTDFLLLEEMTFSFLAAQNRNNLTEIFINFNTVWPIA